MLTRKRKADAESSENFGRKLKSLKPVLSDEEKKQCTFKSPYRQKFSLPDKIIYYAAQHPINYFCHLNFIKSAKSLFVMSRIVLVRNARSQENYGNKWKAGYKSVNIENNFLKFWIIGPNIEIKNKNAYFTSKLVKNIYKCSIKLLVLHKQILYFRELQILISDDENNDLEKVSFVENIIKNGDQTITSFETIFEAILCKKTLETFEIKLCRGEQHGISNGTTRKMIELLEDRKQLAIKIENIPEEFEFQSFSRFLMVNKMKHEIDLNFVDGISSSYKNGIEKFIEKTVDGENLGSSVPFITFMNQNDRNYKKLINRRNGYFECDRPCLDRRCGLHRCHYVD